MASVTVRGVAVAFANVEVERGPALQPRIEAQLKRISVERHAEVDLQPVSHHSLSLFCFGYLVTRLTQLLSVC